MFSHPEVLTILRVHYASLNDDTKVEIKMPGTRAILRALLLLEVEPINYPQQRDIAPLGGSAPPQAWIGPHHIDHQILQPRP